jgi:hypothetical protein
MTRDEIDAEMSKRFDSREEADARAAELGAAWHAMKAYRPSERRAGKYQLSRIVGGV